MKKILITGGASGIGYEMSKHWAEAGYHILWASLVQKEIDTAIENLKAEVGSLAINALTIDLSTPTAAKDVYKWVKDNGWEIDVLINNVGFGTAGYVQSIPMEDEVNMIELNVLSTYKITRFFMTDMLARDAGTIINISSISSFTPVPRLTTYAATKAFIKNFSLGLHQELKWQKSNVSIITVFPAAISDTRFKDRIPKMKTFNGLVTTNSKEVAKDIWNGFKSKKHFIVTGRKMRWVHRFDFLIPDFIKIYFIKKETTIL